MGKSSMSKRTYNPQYFATSTGTDWQKVEYDAWKAQVDAVNEPKFPVSEALKRKYPI